ncbi:MAG: hypothetical protein WCA34_04445, partial [Candidatus Acidiferrales bacterium]
LGPLGHPHGIIFADGKFYFTAELNKLIARYDPATNQVDWLLGVGQNRTHMLVRTKYLNEFFTSNVDSGTVTAIEKSSDPSGYTETNIPVGKAVEGIDISPDDKAVWAANAGDGSVSIIDTATSKVTHTIDARTKHSNRLKFTPDGKLALISDPATGELVIVDTATRGITKMLKVGQGPGGILIVPDGSRAYVALAGDNAVAVIDLHTLEVSGKIPTGQGPDGLAWAVRQYSNRSFAPLQIEVLHRAPTCEHFPETFRHPPPSNPANNQGASKSWNSESWAAPA